MKGTHGRAGAWVSASSFFYQHISGSRSKGIIAIILHYKHQTIFFRRDTSQQLLLPAHSLSTRVFKKLQERVPFFRPLGLLNHTKVRVKAFQKIKPKNKPPPPRKKTKQNKKSQSHPISFLPGLACDEKPDKRGDCMLLLWPHLLWFERCRDGCTG